MNWNNPGNNDGRDPWNNNQEGPPDLDEVLDKIKKRFGSTFGGGKGSSNGSGSGGGAASSRGLRAIIVLSLAVLIVFWLFASIYVVEPGENGVVKRFGKYHQSHPPGLHFAPKFIDTLDRVNVEGIRIERIGFRSSGNEGNIHINSVPSEALMLTKDENIVDLQFAVQYRISDAAAYLYNVVGPSLTLRQSIESAVREIVGRNSMDFVLTDGRDQVADEVKLLTQEILDRYKTGLFITSVNMQDAQPPSQVQDAFLDAINAREDQQRIINEALAYQADVLPKARGEADAIFERAEAYRLRAIAEAEGEASRFLKVLEEYKKAPEITRTRLYLQTIEQVMGNSSKVMMDLEGGGNNLLYLPLDKLITQGAAAAAIRNNQAESSSSPTSGDSHSAFSQQDSNQRKQSNRGRTR